MSPNYERQSRCVDKHIQAVPLLTKGLRELRDIADSLEEKVLQPTNLHSSRWLPHVQASLTVVTKNFTVIITHFDHIRGGRIGKGSDAEVQGRATHISRKLKEYSFLCIHVFYNVGCLQSPEC